MKLSMGNINLVNDIGAPVLYSVAEMFVSKKYPAKAKYVHYGAAVAGYAIAMTGIGGRNMGEFAKNVGIAALPMALKNLYNQFSGTANAIPYTTRISAPPRISRVQYNNPSSVTRSYEPEFNEVGTI
jgi:hypothetical protein